MNETVDLTGSPSAASAAIGVVQQFQRQQRPPQPQPQSRQLPSWMPRSSLPPHLQISNPQNGAAPAARIHSVRATAIPPPGTSINATLHNPSLHNSFGTMGSFGYPQPPPNPHLSTSNYAKQAALATRNLQNQINQGLMNFNYQHQRQPPSSSSSSSSTYGVQRSYIPSQHGLGHSFNTRSLVQLKLNSDKTITLQVNSFYGFDSGRTMPPNVESYRGALGGVKGLNDDLGAIGGDNIGKAFRKIAKDSSRSSSKIQFNKTENRWLIPFDLHDEVNNYFTTNQHCVQLGVVVSAIPRQALNVLFMLREQAKEGEVTVETMIKLGLSKTLAEKLSPYQRTGVKFVYERKGVALIADEMGLGKTVQAIASTSLLKDLWPVLVVCPSGARYHWEREYKLWLSRDTEVQVLNNGSEALDRNANVVVLSYGLVTSLVGSGKLKAGRFQCIIVDESHMLKNPSAKRTKALLPVLLAAKSRILLSGTPAFARPLELFTQLNAVSNKKSFELFRDQKSFKKRYCDGEENSSELHLMLKECMVRRLKKDVLKQLKKKERAIVKYKKVGGWGEKVITGMKKLREGKGKLANIAVEQWEDKNNDEVEVDSSDDDIDPNDNSEEAAKKKKTNILMQLYQDTGTTKIPYVLRHLDATQKPSPSKVIIFAHHQTVLDAVEKRCANQGYKFIRIDGRTSPMKRTELTTKFQDNPRYTVAILSITAAGVAITLTAAHRVIFAELFWTPGLMLQAEDRCHRIGQTSDVQIKYIIGVGTVDEVIWELAKRKFKSLGEFVEGKLGMEIKASDQNAGEQEFGWEFKGEGNDKVEIIEDGIDDEMEEIIRTLGEEEKKAAGLEDEGEGYTRALTPTSFKKAVPDEIICLDDSDDEEVELIKRGTAADPVMLDDSDDADHVVEAPLSSNIKSNIKSNSKMARDHQQQSSQSANPPPPPKRQRASPAPYRVYTHAIETPFLGIVVRFEPSSASAMPQVTVTSVSDRKPDKSLPHINDCLLNINGQPMHMFPTLADLKKVVASHPRPLQLTFLTYGKTELCTVNGISCMKAKSPPPEIMIEVQRQVVMAAARSQMQQMQQMQNVQNALIVQQQQQQHTADPPKTLPYCLYQHDIDTTALGIVVRFDCETIVGVSQVIVCSISASKVDKTLPHINDRLIAVNGQSIYNFATLAELKVAVGSFPRPLQLRFLTYGKTEKAVVNGVDCYKANSPPPELMLEVHKMLSTQAKLKK